MRWLFYQLAQRSKRQKMCDLSKPIAKRTACNDNLFSLFQCNGGWMEIELYFL